MFPFRQSYSLSRDTKRGILYPLNRVGLLSSTRNEDRPDPCEVKQKQGQKGVMKMFCTNCGNQVDASMSYCTKCGAPVGGKPAAPVAREEVKSHMVGAILNLVICLPAGIVPLIYACKVNNKLAQGDIAGAQAASKKAKLCLNISTAVFGVLIVLYLIGTIAQK